MEEREKLVKKFKDIQVVINHINYLNNTKADLELREDSEENRLKITKVKFDIARCQRNLDNMVKEAMGENHNSYNNIETVKTK